MKKTLIHIVKMKFMLNIIQETRSAKVVYKKTMNGKMEIKNVSPNSEA